MKVWTQYFDSTDFVLIVIDSETNEDLQITEERQYIRFNNSDTSDTDTISSALIGVFQDAALAAADFI